eukprot:TRINITY_DN3462_c0_g1_i1.p1 TRINITY_DN3462_c0_g1~~TRINITY_DN3462_c0_g1_i1.p1  ORF type:complete len:136 (+),score=47.44 TRINITY_DN3462_c0_g1_i1:47-454(+)
MTSRGEKRKANSKEVSRGKKKVVEQTALEAEHEKLLREIFTTLDKDKDEQLSLEEFNGALKTVGMEMTEEIKALLPTPKGKKKKISISLPIFLQILSGRIEEKESEEEMREVFKLFDPEGKGRIGITDLERLPRN